EGIDAAAPSAIVAVAAGSYAEDLSIQGHQVRLRGRCPGMVEGVGSGSALAALFIKNGAEGTEGQDIARRGAAEGVLASGSTDVVLSGIWIHDTGGRGLDVEDAYGETGLSIMGSLIESTHDLGVYVSGSDVTVQRSVVRATQPLPSDKSNGRGI